MQRAAQRDLRLVREEDSQACVVEVGVEEVSYMKFIEIKSWPYLTNGLDI